jgi:hypothetical protein
MPDAHKNFAHSTIATAPTPATSGTTLVVQAGEGALFPTPPFNATVWPIGAQPTKENSEIVRVTAINTDTFTVIRNQEDSGFEPIAVGDQIAATITAKVLFDAENPLVTWSPFILGSGAASGLQTLYSNYTAQTGTGSLLMFPITVPQNIQFNQIFVPNSISYVTSNAGSAQATHISKFGLYSLNDRTVLSLISSSYFSICETLQSVSLTWNYPSTTNTTGYGYGNFPNGALTATADIVTYISGTRQVGLQFGRNMYLGEGRYWLGLLALKSTAGSSTYGLSNVGIIGQIMNPINIGGNSTALLPIGLAASQWSGTNNSHFTQWRGRHVAGFVTATSITNFLGTAIPSAVTLSAIGATAANSTVSVLPSVTFVST